VPKLVQKLIRKEGRGENAPALPRLKTRFMRLGRPTNRGSLSAGAGVVAAAVVVVSFLTWLAPDSDRPVPLQLVDRVLPGVAEQVEEQAAALIEGGKEVAQSAARNVREGVLGAGLRAAQDGIPASLSAPLPVVLPTPSSTPTSQSSEEPSAPSEPSAPAMDSFLPATTSEPSTTPTEAPPTGAPPATSEPVTPSPIAEKPPEEPSPPAAEEPPPPAAEEPAPPAEEPGPPAAEEPPITETQPPATGEPPTGAPG
jgi:hypothetical protein